MLSLQNLKIVPLFVGTTTGTTLTQYTGYVDTLGFDEVVITVTSGVTTTTTAPTVMKLQEGDTTSTFADLTGAVGGTDFTIPNNATTAAAINVPAVFHVTKTGARKRYIKCLVTPGVAGETTAIAHMARAGELPNSTTEQNVTNSVRV